MFLAITLFVCLLLFQLIVYNKTYYLFLHTVRDGTHMINVSNFNINDIAVDNSWNFGEEAEYLMHTIHAYPAKFPAFIASKAFDYAKNEGVNAEVVADIFCGCGTVALEAKTHNINFWGCDINPVATLIATTKSESYQLNRLIRYFREISDSLCIATLPENIYAISNERIKYWFTENSYNSLYILKQAILNKVPTGKYQNAFLCIFSSILKGSSKWLTKSIKPQVDPNKDEIDVFIAFEQQFKKFIRAQKQLSGIESNTPQINITTENFLDIEQLPMVDLIISSPPYVTSYEYADLHQLSTLWLDFAEDYRDLRTGSIGSVYNTEEYNLEEDSLNDVGREIILNLTNNAVTKSKIRSIGRYYLDMQKVINKCFQMLNHGGMALFVVGDTEYQGVKINNSHHLIKCLEDAGFDEIKALKRRISNKQLTPYRDEFGRFTSDTTQRTVYHEEFVISGRKWG
jgi:methylase of polypeptide subunit release factors